MLRSLRVINRVLQVLSWLLWVCWAAVFVLALSTTLIDDQAAEGASFMFALGALAVTNVASSLVGATSVLFTRHVKDARAIWLVGFLFALFTWSNVVLVPLFRHDVFNQKLSSAQASTAVGAQVSTPTDRAIG